MKAKAPSTTTRPSLANHVAVRSTVSAVGLRSSYRGGYDPELMVPLPHAFTRPTLPSAVRDNQIALRTALAPGGYGMQYGVEVLGRPAFVSPPAKTALPAYRSFSFITLSAPGRSR
jgi:hypothetical protein